MPVLRGKKNSELSGGETGNETTPNPITGPAFEKVTADQEDWSGTYLLVWEDGNQAFNSALSTLADNAANGKAVTIVDGKIVANDETRAIAIIIEKVDGGYTLKTVGGKYLSKDSNLVGIDVTEDAKIVTITNGQLKGAGGAIFCVDTKNSKNRFVFMKDSYYGSDTADIAFYKLAE